MTPYILLTVFAVVGLLYAEYHEWQRGKWIFKPLASVGFVLAAVAAGATSSTYGLLILAGLVLSLLGDVFLIPKDSQSVFQAGIAAFLLAHVAYCVAFATRGIDLSSASAAFILCAVIAAFVLRWLLPHVEDDMRVPVLAYVFVITLMVVLAGGTVGARGNQAILIGALCFYLSDLSVAYDRFVHYEFLNRLWGLPLYFGAQLVIASSVAAG